jgi:Uncharacterized protein conserved in bacteria
MENLKVKIPIPDIAQVLLNKLQESIIGRSWTMKDLRECCGNKSEDWIKENIIYNRKFSTEIQFMINDGQITESKGKGSPWRFKATAMANFIEKHYEELNW